MSFLGVYRALYDYAPQSDEELEIKEGDLLFVLEKSTDDDWWKCKKKAVSDEDDEPEGLVPNNYIEAAHPTHTAKALYDYTKQTDEELSFQEGLILDIYDQTDPDWTLVGSNGEYGFVPAIYIEPTSTASQTPAATPASPPLPSRPTAADEPIPGEADYVPPSARAASNPATALAGILAQKTGGADSEGSSRAVASSQLPSRPQYTPEESEEDDVPPPSLPQRPQSQTMSSPTKSQYATPQISEPPGVLPSPPYNRVTSPTYNASDDRVTHAPGGFRLYNIHEMIDYLGKSKKLPSTLGIDIAKGTIMISPEKSRDGPSKEWTADKLTHYSIEGKHVFIELVRPTRSADFHAGTKDTAQEIVGLLGELAGVSRAEGLREVLAASSGTGPEGAKMGKMLYEFAAQGDDEVSVDVDDEVIVLDDRKSEEWWMIRRLKNGKEGVVPSSYVEVTGIVPHREESVAGLNAARSIVEQNRLEEERLAREAAKKDKKADSIPERNSSLTADASKSRSQRSSSSKSKPNSSKLRTWTDRSGSFKVEAEFIGLRDNKIHLHKVNGVKIAVPVAKMAVEDLEYVEQATGVSLDDDKPLSDIKRRSTQYKKEDDRRRAGGVGASIERKEEYDWFDFFLGCGVNPQICERYASAFKRDQIGPENMADINEQLLRTLGLKEGDILRVMKFLNNKYGRTPDQSQNTGGSSLFSGEGGVLKNNTRKGRPAPPVQTDDVVSDEAFKQAASASPLERSLPADAKATPLASAAAQAAKAGFDDDAWDVKPARSQTPVVKTPEPPQQAEAPNTKINDDIASLSLSSPPLQPTPVSQSIRATSTSPAQEQSLSQPPGANQAIFDKIAALAPARPRPQAPPITQTVGGLNAPPRPISAPGIQQPHQSAFGPPPPLQAQYTGYLQQPQQQYQQLQGQQVALPPGFPQQQANGFPATNGYHPPQNSLQALQQHYPSLQPQPTGLAFQPQSQFGAASAAQHYGLPQQQGYQQQQLVNGAQTGSPFADPPRQPFQPVPSNLQYQQTAAYAPGPTFNISQATGINGFQAQPPPQLPPQQTGGVLGPPQPLLPQKTGPPPPVRFGLQPGANKLTVQPTGRANLSKATPQNPFGF